MESGKIDIDSEVKGSKEPVATYKSIPEDDFVLAVKEPTKEEVKMAKHDGDTDTEDGAQELMLKDTGKINSNKEASEVKFISENGDAKIDIEAVKQALTGMTKEELMKSANDPFWIRLRWFMFIAFWLLWAGMLAGAIAIIVMAPKCAAPEPRKLWQESPIARIDGSVSKGNLKGLVTTLDNLQKKNIRVISIGSILKKSSEGHTTDFRDIEPELGTIQDFEELVKNAHKREQEIVLEIDPNYSSIEHPWFNQSVNRNSPYTDYYVWQKSKTGHEQPTPPNNWLSRSGGSAWEWNNVRKEYYLHQFNVSQADLNYGNPNVIAEFSNILTFWMKRGITGFRLANTQYLLEDLSGGDERNIHASVNPEDYDSLNHVYTRDVNNNSFVLRNWRQVVSNHTGKNGLFSLQEDIRNDTLEVFNDNSTLIDLPQKSQFLANANASISASAIRIGVNVNLPSSKAWPGWNLNGQEKPLNDRMPAQVAESLTLMFMLLPGTPILSLAQIQNENKALEAVIKARSEPAFLHGDLKASIANETIFVYTRLKSGNPGYLVAYQSANETGYLNLATFDKVSDEVMVIALSSNYHEDKIAVKDTIPSDRVPISAKSTLVVQFAPKGA